MINTSHPAFLHDYEELTAMFPLVKGDIFVGIERGENNYKFSATVGDKTCALVREVYGDLVEQKRLLKRYSKLCLYNALSSFTGVQLPWGALTGIRPVKFARNMPDYKKVLKETFSVREDKISLIGEILKTQSEIDLNTSLSDVYVGIPFCPTRCSYCSFISAPIGKNTPVNEYIDCLCREIEAFSDYLSAKTGRVYIGGGTPASLSLEQTEKLLKTLSVKSGTEFTVEAGRPDCITREKLDLYLKYGVTRICVNPQTFNDKTLKKIGRLHTCEQTERVLEMAKDYPFSVNSDLIAGLEDESLKDFKYTLDKLMSFSPDDVTVHTLCLKAGSVIKTRGDELSGEQVGEMLDYAHSALIERGYRPYYLYRQKYMAGNYENVGYSLKGKECKYNVGVMEEITDNIAFGAGANSKLVFGQGEKIQRYYPPKDVATYINKIEDIIKEKKVFFSKKSLQL